MAAARRAATLAATAALAAGAPACGNLTGTWVDRAGNVATLLVHADGAISAVSHAPATSWRTAVGAAAPDGSALWVDFALGNQSGVLVTNCSLISWAGGGSFWSAAGPSLAPAVSDVHIVSMAHLDLGYTALARDVCDLYFDLILPANLALAASLRGSATPFRYTTHAFLVAEFLDGAAGCAHAPQGPAALAAMRDAIAHDEVQWHAQPAILNMELLSPATFGAMLTQSDALDAAFNKSWGSRFLKSTDVAGMSRSVVPLLAAAGRQALHMGVNGKCKLAYVPSAFTWAHPESGTSVLALASNDYGGLFVVPPHALFIQYQGDNSGPPSARDVAGFYADMAARFPGASVFYSSLDNFTQAVLPAAASALPVVSSEVGDAWLYGAPSDPLKLAAFRETQRVVADALAGALPGGAPALRPDDAHLRAFQRRLLVGGPEHNGGLSVGAYLPAARSPTGNWSNAEFHPLVNRSDYAYLASSWTEKRALLEPLAPGPGADPAWAAFLAARAARVASVMAPAPPPVAAPGSGYVRVAAPAAPVTCGRLSAAFSPVDGSLSHLVDVATGHAWAAPNASVLAFVYRTYSEDAFDAFNAEFTPACGVPCPNFGHVGMRSAGAVDAVWPPTLTALYVRQAAPGAPCSFAAQLAMPPATVAAYGGSQVVWLEVDVDADAASSPDPTLGVRLSWFGKTATRLAESSWLSFVPNLARGGPAPRAAPLAAPAAVGRSGWWLDVLGSRVWPEDVVAFGTRHVHGVDSGFGFDAAAAAPAPVPGATVRGFNVTTLDAFLVSPGDTAHLLHYDGEALPDMAGGMHAALHGNLWGTAFPQWFGEDAAFRFSVALRV